jgi:hypothetical protein
MISMKTHLPLFGVFALLSMLLIGASASSAQVLYENGPINGQDLAFTINFGFTLGDTFFLPNNDTTVTGFSFGAWLSPGDVLQSAEVYITSEVGGGTFYFDQQVNFSQSGCFLNDQSYDVCTETAGFNGPTLDSGTYWVNLANGITADGDPAYWDVNQGVGCHSQGCPSLASENEDGTIPSESFTVLGSAGTGTTPEPRGLFLFASGVMSCGMIVRRKLL